MDKGSMPNNCLCSDNICPGAAVPKLKAQGLPKPCRRLVYRWLEEFGLCLMPVLRSLRNHLGQARGLHHGYLDSLYLFPGSL